MDLDTRSRYSGSGGLDTRSQYTDWAAVRKQKRTQKRIEDYNRFAQRAVASPALPSLLEQFKKKAKEGDEDARIRYNAIQAVRGRKTMEPKTKVEKVILEGYKPKNNKERQVS